MPNSNSNTKYSNTVHFKLQPVQETNLHQNLTKESKGIVQKL